MDVRGVFTRRLVFAVVAISAAVAFGSARAAWPERHGPSGR